MSTSDYELYMKLSNYGQYSNKKEFNSKMLQFLNMKKEDLEISFNKAEKNDNVDDCMLILLAFMRRKAEVHFNPLSKLLCDYCKQHEENIIILKDCYHGYCKSCLISKVEKVTEKLIYEEYFKRQENCRCDLCNTPIKISNLVEINILNEKGDKNSYFCKVCNKMEDDEFIDLTCCHNKICKKKFIPYLKNKFKIALENSSLDKVVCPIFNCGKNIANFLISYYEDSEILDKFPYYYETYFN